MVIGTVTGSIVSTRKHQDLIGNKFLIVETLESICHKKETLVSIDTVGAGIGDIVLVVTGSAARCSVSNSNAPIDAAIVGIVDEGNHIISSRA